MERIALSQSTLHMDYNQTVHTQTIHMQSAHDQQLNNFKAMIKCVAAFAQIGSEDIDKMNLEQVNSYLGKLQDEAMFKFMLMVNEPVD